MNSLTKYVQVLIPSKVSNGKSANALAAVSIWHPSWRIGKVAGDEQYFSCLKYVRFLHRSITTDLDFKKLVAAGVRGKLVMVTVYQANKSLAPTAKQLAAAIDLTEAAS